jgi:hypothetical protein
VRSSSGRVSNIGDADMSTACVPVTRRRIARLIVAAVVVLAGALGSVSSASAIDLGAGDNAPVIAYEPTTQTTYVAWRESGYKSVELCVLPPAATACLGGAPYMMKDAKAESGIADYNGYGSPQLVVEPEGGVVLVADLDPVSAAATPSGWTSRGVVAWSSAAGGAAFGQSGQGLDDGGELLAPERGYTPEQGAVALGSSEVGVFGNAYPFGDGFAAFGLSKPFAKEESESPEPDTTELFGTEQSDDGTQMAALPNTPKSGEDLVVTVGADNYSADAECPGSEHLSGFGYADATFANLNKQSSWEAGGKKFKAIDCEAEAPVLAGGASGIGVLEDEGPGLQTSGLDSIDYRKFNASTHSFEAPILVSEEAEHTLSGAGSLSVSQDTTGGVYAMWSDGRGKELSYSPNGGANWDAPVSALVGEASDPVVVGIGAGTAEAAYEAPAGGGTQIFLDQFNYAELAVQPTSIATTLSGDGQSGDDITVPDGAAVTDTASLSGNHAGEATGAAGYAVYSNSSCSTLAATAGSGAISGGTAAPSTAETLPPGTYYWAASYAGDANNAGSSSSCTSEVLHVLAPTSVSTAQSGGGISGASLTEPQGTAVSDKAQIAGEFAASAGGTVSYALYKDSKCTVVASAASVGTVVNGVATPSAAVALKAGTYYWKATYSGDAANEGSVSTCGSEVLIVALNAKNLGLPSSKMCLSRRHFLVHPRAPKGVKLVSVEVQINGKFVKKGKLNEHATSVSLVGLPKGTFKVALITTSSKGKVYEEVRTFHTCVPSKHNKGKRK